MGGAHSKVKTKVEARRRSRSKPTPSTSPPTAFVPTPQLLSWTPKELAEHLVKWLPQALRERCSKRIIEKGVTGADVFIMALDCQRFGDHVFDVYVMAEHETFKRIFDESWAREFQNHSRYLEVRHPGVFAMRTFLMSTMTDDCSVLIGKVHQRVFEIIRPDRRDPLFDAFYPLNENWCVACGEETKGVMATDGKTEHVAGYYMAPAGWHRLALKVQADGEKDFKADEWTSWHKAYHGTRGEAVESIAKNGLVPPGMLAGGVKIKNLHGHAGVARGKPKPIYVSPSLEYSAHPIFTDKGSHVQFVFEVRVKPGSYKIQGNTLARDWPRKPGVYKGAHPKTEFMPYEAGCQSDMLEWLIFDPAHIVCTGVMVRHLPQSVEKHNTERVRQLKDLTLWDEEKGPQRSRTLGTPAGYSGQVQWAWNDAPTGGSVLLYDDKQKWKRYDSKTSALIEAAYQEYQRYVFIGTPQGARGPYCIHFGTAWHKDAGHGPQQRSADGEKNPGWRQRAIRREPRSAV